MTHVIEFFNTHRPKSSPGTLELALDQADAPEGTIAIDICCGSGRLAAMAAERGLHAYGVDIASAFIGTEADNSAAFVVGDMMHVPFENGCAGVVFSIDSLQYAPNPDHALAEMARLLQPGGVLVFSTQNTYNPAGFKKFVLEKLTGRTWSPWLAHPIERSITYPWLIKALRRHGFDIEYVRGRQHLIAWVSLLPRLLRTWSPWPGKSWRSLQGIAQRMRLPARVEESALARFGMILLVRARKR
ncbi:MAG: class I SAM-dependent methyltransferase [Anaerolineae bacterium]|nr:class I SAM-dependent methyltransferase [Anaerolineae bacterium]